MDEYVSAPWFLQSVLDESMFVTLQNHVLHAFVAILAIFSLALHPVYSVAMTMLVAAIVGEVRCRWRVFFM